MPPAARQPRDRRRHAARAAIVLLTCFAAACAPAAADDAPSAAPSAAPAVAPAAAAPDAAAPAEAAPADAASGTGAVAVARRAATVGEGMPDVTGASLDDARASLGAAGARGSALVFGDAATVTAQFPAPGQAVPDGANVVVWVGAPAGVTIEVLGPAEPAGPAGPTRPLATSPEGAAPDAGAPATPGRPADGLASWYGPGFEGDVTPCGVRVDPAQVTFAGPDLPCGTRVRVTGPDGHSIEAVLTDRGPAAWTGRRYNLSRAAFAELADLATGEIPVRVEPLG